MMRALVTMTGSPTSIFVVRRLHDLGYEVTAIDSNRRSYCSYSNAVQKTLVAPSLREQPRQFAEFVLSELKRSAYDVYFPVFECGFLMAYYQDEIRQLTRMVSMPYPDIQAAHNKENLQIFGRKADVRVIENTHAPTSLEEARSLCQTIDYPVVIKGKSSCNAHGQSIVLDPAGLDQIYLNLVERQGWTTNLPLIQQFITGSMISSVSFANQGQKVGGVIFKALHTVPRIGGTSSYRETIDHPVCEQFDRRLIETLNWTGFISFDYMQDDKTGEVFLIDCNPRLAPGVALGYFAGTDMIQGYLDLAYGRTPRPLDRAMPGIRSKLSFLDLGWMLHIISDRSLLPKQKWQFFLEWIKRTGAYDDILDWHDLLPVAALYLYLVRHAVRLLGPHGGEIFYQHALFQESIFWAQLESV